MRLTILTVPTGDVEVAADRLWIAGAGAVEERPAPHGLVELHTVLAGDDATSLTRLGSLPASWTTRFESADRPTSEAWRDHVRPIDVEGGLVLCPAWLDAPDDAAAVVRIEPGGSFGLGDHPTTRLAAEATWRLTRPAAAVVDVGCGSGVLGITALLRGAARVTAIDIAEAAREATLANATLNGVGERIRVSCDPLAEVEGEFDLVLANILAPTLIALAGDLRRVLAPGGVLVISGVLAGRHAHVLDALAPLVPRRTAVLEGWACVELVNPTS